MTRFASTAVGLALALAIGWVWAQPAGTAPVSGADGATATAPGTAASAPARRAASAPEAQQRSAGALRSVEVTGRRDEVEQRRNSTAAKIVIGREEIEQYGDATLSDVLKRLPSVTVGGRPGRGGRIAMRGMGNGYTQILIDGERIPPGFAIDEIAPEQVERIEIYRAPTAETGARAIAGTINIILREPLRLRGDDVRAGLARDAGRVQPNVSWSRNDTLGPAGTYNLTLSLSHTDRQTDTQSRTTWTNLDTGHLDLQQDRATLQHEERNHLHLSSRLQWQLGQGDQVSIQPFVVISQGRTQVAGTLDQSAGLTPAPYATNVSDGSGHSAFGRVLANLRKRIDDATRLDLSGSVGGFEMTTGSLLNQYAADGTPGLVQSSNTSISDRSWSVSGKLSHLYAERHSLVGGLEAEGARRLENSLTLINGLPSIADFDGDVQASTRRLAAYLQDEWEPSPAWSAHAGLRWEGIQTQSSALASPVSNRGSVLTPLMHAVWRFNPPARDQLRISLTRSYRTPTLQNLVALPVLSTLYPAPGPNAASSADRAGNPVLRPEIARGIDVALEHYLPMGGIVSANLFRRDIQDLIRNVTALETVPWAVAQRWVSRPQNLGAAVSQGIELDAKVRLDELVDDQPPVALRANLGVFRSHVEGVPGPDNRIDQQPRATANLGAEYRWRGMPLTVGGNLNWVPAYDIQLTDLQRQSIAMTCVVDAFMLWTFSPGTRLRFSLGNLVPRRYPTSSSILDGRQLQTVVSNGPTYRVVSFRLELKL